MSNVFNARRILINWAWVIFLSIAVSCQSPTADDPATADFYHPGVNVIGRSYTVKVSNPRIAMKFTLDSITVGDDLSLKFDVTFSLSVDPAYTVTKHSDVGNPNMNISDSAGTVYYATAWLDAVGEEVVLHDGETCTGSYVFPAISPGMDSVVLHDDDNARTITVKQKPL